MDALTCFILTTMTSIRFISLNISKLFPQLYTIWIILLLIPLKITMTKKLFHYYMMYSCALITLLMVVLTQQTYIPNSSEQSFLNSSHG